MLDYKIVMENFLQQSEKISALATKVTILTFILLSFETTIFLLAAKTRKNILNNVIQPFVNLFLQYHAIS